MNRQIAVILSVFMLLAAVPFSASAEEMDPLQKFFVYAMSLDGDTRVALVDVVKQIHSTADLSQDKTDEVQGYVQDMSAEEVDSVLKIIAHRSVDNQSNIQDLILFGMKEMPFLDQIPTIAARFNHYIIGNESDNRGVNFFSTLISVYNMYTLFGGDATIASNNDAFPGLIHLFTSDNMPQDVIKNVSGALVYMPTLKATISPYPGETPLQQLFAFAEELVNDCSSDEIYYFKFAMDKLHVFRGTAAGPENNKKYPGVTFRDLDDFEWALDPITTLVAAGVINGNSRYSFDPGGNVTREQFVKLIAAAFHIEGESEQALPFSDVNPEEWYYPYLSAAYANGLITGESADYFGVGNAVTREQMAVITYRACQKLGVSFASGTPVTFTDGAQISAYAQTAVSAMAANQILQGVGGGRFDPQSLATRAEAAMMTFNTIHFVS